MAVELKIAQCYLYFNGGVLVKKGSANDEFFNKITASNKPEFSGKTFDVYQLGIQSKPGLKVNLVDNGTIMLGQTGIFELNLSQATPLVGTITIENIDILQGGATDSNGELESCNYCLIDVIYAKNNNK